MPIVGVGVDVQWNLSADTITFICAALGQGGDIHGVQHNLHCVVRIPQAVVSFSPPPVPPHPFVSVIELSRYTVQRIPLAGSNDGAGGGI